MILAFAKKRYSADNICFISKAFFLSQERQLKKRKKKVIRPGLERMTFRFQFQAGYLLSHTVTRPRLFHFLTLLFNSSSSGY